MKDNANDSTRTSPKSQGHNPFVVPGAKRSVESTSNTQNPPTREDPPAQQGSMVHNPFRWVVPNGSVTGAESNPSTLVSSPALPGHDHGDAPQQSTQINNNPTTRPVPETGVHSSIPRRTNPVDYSGLLDGRNDLTEDVDDDDDPFILNGHSEDESPTGEDSFIWTGPVDETDGDPQSRVSTRPHGGDGDRLLAQLEHESTGSTMTTLTTRSNVTVREAGVYAVDSSRLREGVQIGTVKRELIEYRPRAKRRPPRPKTRAPFSPQIPKILDFLTRWRIGTTVQLARVAGWRDPNKNRLVKKLRSYDEVGFLRETDLYAGPKIWTATEHGAERGFHPWLGGVKASEINPMSQSHSFGLSSIASWLLTPWDTTPNILGLSTVEWNQVRGEIRDGTASVLAEREYRSSYSSIRTTRTGLLPAEYRHGFIGGPGGQTLVPGAWREWARRFKNGDSTLDESPELLACDPEFMGAGLWMWIIWGNSVWNPKVLETRAAGEGIDLDDPEWAGRDGGARLLTMFRQYGYVPVEERLDIATNKPLLNKTLGDRFALWDHLPDMIIARRRTPDGRPQSIAIELELTAKSILDYARTMAAYGSTLGQTLYRRVIWLVPSKTIADKIRDGASQVGMILGEDYDIVPFVTSNEASVIKRSFYSGSDLLPGKWSQRGLIEPCETRSIPLA